MSSFTRTTHHTSTLARIHSASRRPKIIGADTERCFFCDGTIITRRGKRHKKHEIVQLWYCYTRDIVFTPQRTKGKTYPLKIILEGCPSNDLIRNPSMRSKCCRLLVSSVRSYCNAVAAIRRSASPMIMAARRNLPRSRPKIFAVSSSRPTGYGH